MHSPLLNHALHFSKMLCFGHRDSFTWSFWQFNFCWSSALVCDFFFFFFASGYLLCHICLWVMLSHCAGPLACVVHGNFVSWCWFLELEMLLLTFSSSSLLMLLGSPKSLMHSLHEYSSCSDILCSGLMSLSSKFVWGLYNWFLYLILVHYIIL